MLPSSNKQLYEIEQHKLKKGNSFKKKPKADPSEIINFYEHIPDKFLDKAENPNFHLHHFDIPFRACVVAPSGSGKTNFILNLIRVFSQGKGTFSDIQIITSNKDEPLYNWLSSINDSIRITEGIDTTPKLDDFDKTTNHLVIWDDLVLSKNLDYVKKYYMRARKKNVSILFLSQSYADIDKFIRKNSNYLILFDLGGSKREQDYILREWGSDLEKEELRAIYEDAVSEQMRPLIIKGGKTKKNEKYRKGFLDYYNLDEFLKSVVVKPKKTKKPKIKYFSSSDSE